MRPKKHCHVEDDHACAGAVTNIERSRPHARRLCGHAQAQAPPSHRPIHATVGPRADRALYASYLPVANMKTHLFAIMASLAPSGRA